MPYNHWHAPFILLLRYKNSHINNFPATSNHEKYSCTDVGLDYHGDSALNMGRTKPTIKLPKTNKICFCPRFSLFLPETFFIMKKTTLILAVIWGMIAFCIAAQEALPHKKIIIIDGKFFYNLPEGVAKMKTPDGIKFFMVSTPNGTKAVGIKMPEPLTNEVLRDTIPMVHVPEAAELLRRFEEAKSSSDGIKISSGKTEPLLKEGTKFPDFTSTDIDGRIWSNADVKDKVMVLSKS